MARRGGEGGQASVDLIAAMPALALAVLLMAQLALAGYGLWSAGAAARAGARAAYVGGDAERAARASLPGALRSGATVTERNGVQVRVRVPSLVPGLSRVPLAARAALGVGEDGGR
jgi:pilus assembly protein CpaE